MGFSPASLHWVRSYDRQHGKDGTPSVDETHYLSPDANQVVILPYGCLMGTDSSEVLGALSAMTDRSAYAGKGGMRKIDVRNTQAAPPVEVSETPPWDLSKDEEEGIRDQLIEIHTKNCPQKLAITQKEARPIGGHIQLSSKLFEIHQQYGLRKTEGERGYMPLSQGPLCSYDPQSHAKSDNPPAPAEKHMTTKIPTITHNKGAPDCYRSHFQNSLEGK
ncbi:uncharacterized protein BT62DRAFT_924826 [Guyanagaster necrorhizus]|uniref:Uncharacterized protein n=1 Tax=Guyanagaster necrorhizus TaxID=856835 RepID=A0A9P7VEW0_9AGAR|nr:uncharacterized protein BT62DRAFT_924826 [Guyanagaster necrorhizus MCA 3950]KAG7439270.1 hypothetical protein BT62DRAFT_924826 [Guyanagaster necrorhizus MCA 3950]